MNIPSWHTHWSAKRCKCNLSVCFPSSAYIFQVFLRALHVLLGHLFVQHWLYYTRYVAVESITHSGNFLWNLLQHFVHGICFKKNTLYLSTLFKIVQSCHMHRSSVQWLDDKLEMQCYALYRMILNPSLGGYTLKVQPELWRHGRREMSQT